MKKQQNSNDYNVKGGNAAPAGNDLPQQLEVGYDLDNNDVGIVDLSRDAPVIVGGIERRLAAEIVRRYNDFPALQEQNRELLEALKLLHKGANLCDMAFTPANISAGMLITKYSK